ncbi:MAG: hypothetical protein JXB32_12845 [Deltaproteobacteria bacterium]|nr:hypothetical protein [Deltaproteobacteria bacterium]
MTRFADSCYKRPMTPPGAVPPSAGPFSWKRAVFHALFALAGVVAAGGVLAAVTNPVDPFRFGEGIGRFAAVAALVAFGASWLHQTGRRRLARLVVGAVVALLVATVVAVFAIDRPGRRAPPELTAAERQEPVPVTDGAASRLRQAALGFSIPHPGAAFQALSPGEARELSRVWNDPSMHAWGWVDETRGAALVVGALKGLERREDIEGFRRGMVRSLQSSGGAAVETDELVWEEGRRESRLTATVQGVHLAARSTLLPRSGGRAPLFVVLVALTLAPGELGFVLEGLRAD